MLNETWGQVHFVLTFVGFNLTFLPMHVLGLQGMPRRVAEYDPQFSTLNLVCSVGAYILAVSTLPFVVNVLWSWFAGRPAGDNPWQGLTLEWMTTSPPPVENFQATPVLATGPYDYGLGVVDREPDSSGVEVAVPLSTTTREPLLSAGPSSVLRADPNSDDPEAIAQNR